MYVAALLLTNVVGFYVGGLNETAIFCTVSTSFKPHSAPKHKYIKLKIFRKRWKMDNLYMFSKLHLSFKYTQKHTHILANERTMIA